MKMIKNEIELCGLLWDRDNLTIGGYEKDGHHYYTWHEAMEAARSVGKRLPTRYEWEELCDLGSTWDDELKGRWFGGNHDSDHKGSLFLPAAGWQNISGELVNTSFDGYYWSSLLYDKADEYVGNLYFISRYVTPTDFNYCANGFSVRCVRDKE